MTNAAAEQEADAELDTIIGGAAHARDYAGPSKPAATIKAYAPGWRVVGGHEILALAHIPCTTRCERRPSPIAQS